jgi:hypothetical protein
VYAPSGPDPCFSAISFGVARMSTTVSPMPLWKWETNWRVTTASSARVESYSRPLKITDFSSVYRNASSVYGKPTFSAGTPSVDIV